MSCEYEYIVKMPGATLFSEVDIDNMLKRGRTVIQVQRNDNGDKAYCTMYGKQNWFGSYGKHPQNYTWMQRYTVIKEFIPLVYSVNIKDLVKNNKSYLLTANSRQLRAFANDNHINNKTSFSIYKKALESIGVMWDEVGEQSRKDLYQRYINQPAGVRGYVKLYATTTATRWGLFTPKGKALWYGSYTGAHIPTTIDNAKKDVFIKSFWLANTICSMHVGDSENKRVGTNLTIVVPDASYQTILHDPKIREEKIIFGIHLNTSVSSKVKKCTNFLHSNAGYQSWKENINLFSTTINTEK